MRRQVSVGILASILLYGPICIAQTPSPPPSTVPASLLVPDRFVRAVKNQSTAPSFLMVTIINDTTGETKRVCIESIQLFGAVRTENQWGRGRQGWGKTRELLLNNASHTFHFKNKDAWAQVQPRYSPQMLAAVEEEFRPLSTTELAARFDYDKTSGIVPIDENTPPEKIFDYCAAAAYVLTERGLLVGRGDFGNSLYVITPAMLAEEDALEKTYAEERKRSVAEGQAFAARLPGYRAVTRRFNVNWPEVSEFWAGPAFSVSLEAPPSYLVSSLDWLNPIHKKTGKARYDWNRFLPIAAHIEHMARRHPWLYKWKAVGPNRSIEAQMYGTRLNNELDDDFTKDIVPAWKDAGLKGIPYCQLMLFWPDDEENTNELASATLYLPQPGSGENRSLIVNSFRPPHVRNVGTRLHWLDRTSFHSFAVTKARQVIVVSPRGEWKWLTLPTRRSAGR